MNEQLHLVEDDVIRAFDQAGVARITQATVHGHPELIGYVPDCVRCRRQRYGRLWWLRRP